MNQLFFNHFKLASEKTICLLGGEGKNALIQLLAQESVLAGYRALVVSTAAMRYPIEGKVLLSEEINLTLNLVRNAQPEIIYLARNVSDDYLLPFNTDELNLLVVNSGQDSRLFIDIISADSSFYKNAPNLADSLVICQLNFSVLSDELLQLSQKVDLNSHHEYVETAQERMREILSQHCPFYQTLETKREKIIFIGQMKNILDENILIPIARHLKACFASRVLYGNLNQYQIKEV